MNKYIIILLGILALLSCSEDKLDTYDTGNFLNFVQNSKTDSLEISFFFNPGKDELIIPLEFALTGNLLKEDKEFQMIVDTSSTAQEGSYILPEKFVFKANKTIDTLYLTLRNTPELETGKYKLALRIEDNENFNPGFKNNCLRKIYFTSMVSKPKWWNEEIRGVYLGDFSAKKYLLFCEVTGQTDLTDINPSLIRQYALTFKRYLLDNPTQEEDGSWMEVTVIG